MPKFTVVPFFIMLTFAGYSKTEDTTESQQTSGFPYSYENREMTVNAGEEFFIELKDGGGTGHMWYLLTSGPAQKNDLFKFVRKDVVAEKKSDPMLMGGPGPKHRWVFKATRAAEASIPLIFINKGPGGNPPVKQIAVYVKVVPKTK